MEHKTPDVIVSLLPLPLPLPRRRGRRRLVVPALALGAALTLTACSGDPDPEAAVPVPTEPTSAATTPAPPLDDGAVVIEPGLPGEPAATGDAAPAAGPEWNDADTAFLEMMVPHHTQALMMADLAQEHAVDPAVRAISQRIGDAQGPEVLAMSTWLDDQGIEPDRSMSGTEMGGMSGMSDMGMLTDPQLDELAAARGSNFDRLFLEGMIGHHQGAVDMAADVLVEGSDVRVAELAADMTAGQSAEIARMQEMLDRTAP